MPKVSFTVGEFRKFLQDLPASMSASSALRAFLVARGAVNPRARIRTATLRVKKAKGV
ncbi:MAG: hypothetical protein [Microviridae sp. ctbuH30]|nr:MAG: hypothetical protein [Microviridae sp. ctbuH30]